MAPDRNDDRTRDPRDNDGDRWQANARQDDGENAQSESDNGKKDKKSPFASPWIRIGIVIVVLLLIAGGIIWWLIARNYEDTDDAFIDTHIVHV